MFYLFQYETESYPELSRVPLHVRMKLDLTGIKLALKQWLAFSLAERRVICHLPVKSADELETFVKYISFLCQRYTGNAVEIMPPMSPSKWDTPHQIPRAVIEKSLDSGLPVTLEEWTCWQFHERYALYKTAVSKSEPDTFFAVLTELRQRRTDGNSQI